MLANPALERLLQYGLTEYEGRTYLALLAVERATARDLANVSRVPRTKIYGVLDDLHLKGLAQELPGRPKRYQAVPVDAYLSRFEDDIRARLVRIQDDRKVLAGEFRRAQAGVRAAAGDARTRAGNFHVVKGRANVMGRVLDMLGKAQGAVLLSGSATLPDRLLQHTGLLRDLAARGVQVRVVCAVSQANEGSIAMLRGLAEVRPSPLPSAASATVLIDARESLLVHFVPDDLHATKGDDAGIWSDDRAIVADLQRTVEQQWDLAPA